MLLNDDYHYVVRILRIAFLCVVLFLSRTSNAQDNHRGLPFGTRFFQDLRRVFGELQRSELDRAFQAAKAPQCSELAKTHTEWKHVAYLNDDRTLAAWHFDSIEEVKRDPSKYIFEGTCRTEDSPLMVVTSFPLVDGLNRPMGTRENAPVRTEFDRRTQSVVFELPYLYQVRTNGSETLYSLLPPLFSSTPASNVAEQIRCKALSDSELTYRFLICRARLMDRSPRSARRVIQRPLGGAAYYILSDGNEATSTVKLTYEDAVEQAVPHAVFWQEPAAKTGLAQVVSNELRIQFDTALLNGSSNGSKIISHGQTSDLTSSGRPNGDYCIWYPVDTMPRPGLDISSTLVLRKDSQSTISAAFEMQTGGHPLGTLLCYFSPVDKPDDVNVVRWQSITGRLVTFLVANKQ